MDTKRNSVVLGRDHPVNVVTVFAATDKNEEDKRHLFSYDGHPMVHDLDPNKDLIAQWKKLPLPPNGPDLILTKLHHVIGTKDTDSEAAATLGNYESLRNYFLKSYGQLEVAHLEKEFTLANRFPMQDLIAKACDAVNFTLQCGLPYDQYIEKVELSSKVQKNLGLTFDGFGGIDRHRALCRVPPSIQVESPEDAFSDRSPDASLGDSKCPALPPFPLIVKPCSTAVKSMAMVADEPSLRHFSGSIGKSGVVIEQFIQHDGVILKMYVVGKDIWVVRRPSLPNVTSFSESDIRGFANNMGGDFVSIEDSPSGGYVVFLSNEMPKSSVSTKLLEECGDLDVPLFRSLTAALAIDLGCDLFGFDALVQSETKKVFVCDVNFLPGYKGIPDCKRRLSEWLEYIAFRKAFKADRLSLSNQDVLSLSLETTNKNGKKKDLSPKGVSVVNLAQNRLFKVSFEKNIGKNKGKHALVKFFPPKVPRRLIVNKEVFMKNIAVALSAQNLAPAFVKDITANYFGRIRHLGTTREWVNGQTLMQLLSTRGSNQNFLTGSDSLFGRLGKTLAQFHALIDNANFRRDVIDIHFPGAAPMLLARLEEWRRGALLSLHGSRLQGSKLWGDLYRRILNVATNSVEIVDAAVRKLKTNDASLRVFSHNDCSLSNIVVRGSNGLLNQKEEIMLIDEEWAAPNLAIYDFSDFVMVMKLWQQRGIVNFGDGPLRHCLVCVVKAYLAKKGAKNDANRIQRFVDDILAFVPVVAMTHCFSNLVHASKEGQLTDSIPVTDGLYDDKGVFNWLCHATNHLNVLDFYSDIKSRS